MALKFQTSRIKCPPYKHSGIFIPDDQTVRPLLPDLKSCATCMACEPPYRPDLQEDLFQIASLTLIEKGPLFKPKHKSGASFRSFIRFHICGALTDAKNAEIEHSIREGARLDRNSAESSTEPLLEYPDPNAEFEDELLRKISIEASLPRLLENLTQRERAVFKCIRQEQRAVEIAKTLNISEARVSQLAKRLVAKVTYTAQQIGLADQPL